MSLRLKIFHILSMSCLNNRDKHDFSLIKDFAIPLISAVKYLIHYLREYDRWKNLFSSYCLHIHIPINLKNNGCYFLYLVMKFDKTKKRVVFLINQIKGFIILRLNSFIHHMNVLHQSLFKLDYNIGNKFSFFIFDSLLFHFKSQKLSFLFPFGLEFTPTQIYLLFSIIFQTSNNLPVSHNMYSSLSFIHYRSLFLL